MAWARRAIGTLTSRSDLGSLTVAVPGSVAAGDLLVMFGFHSDKDGAFGATVSGTTWTQRMDFAIVNGGRLQLWTKIAGPSESNPVLTVADWTTPDTYDCSAGIVAYSGIFQSVPDGGVSFGGGTLTNWGITPLTTTASNDLVLIFGGLADALATWNIDTPANLSSLVELFDTRLGSVGGVFNMQTENSSFESDFWNQNGWSVYTSGCNNTPTWTRTATNAVDGSYAGRLQYTANALDTAGSIGLYGTLTGVGTVVPGQVMSVGFNLRGVNTGCTVRIGARWYDSAGQYITRSTDVKTINNTSMDRYTMTTTGAPSTPLVTSQAQINLQIEGIANGDSIDLYFDCAQIEMGDTPHSYGGGGGSGMSLAGWEANLTNAGSTGSVAGDCADYTTNANPAVGMLAFKAMAVAPPPDTDPNPGHVYAYTDAWKVAPPQAYVGGSWHSCGVLTYVGSRWVPVIDPESPTVPVPEPTDVFNAMTDGAVGDRCHNDGSSDDKAHLDAQANAALNAGQALYLPGGTGYKLDSQWNVPAGLLVVGDGSASSKLLGKVGWRSNVELRKLRIGTYSDSALIPYSVSTLYENVVVRDCRLRGGTSPLVNFPGGRGRIRGISFIDSVFEVPHTSYGIGGQAHCIAFMGDASLGDLFDTVNISRCHFGVPNDYNETYSMYGNLIFYMHNLTGGTGYAANINITDSVFELTYQWCIDFAAYNDAESSREWPSTYPYNTAYIARNEFRGSGKIKDFTTTPEYPWTLDIEPLCGGIIEDNVFWPCSASPIRTTWNTANMIVRNNVFDYRQDSGVTPYMPGDYWNSGYAAADYMRSRQIYFYDGGANVAYGNRLYLPAEYAGQQTANGWIAINDGGTWGGKTYARSTAYDNSVYFGGEPGDIGE